MRRALRPGAAIAVVLLALTRVRLTSAGYARFRNRAVSLPSLRAAAAALLRPDRIRAANACYRLAELVWAAQALKSIEQDYRWAMGLSSEQYALSPMVDAAAAAATSAGNARTLLERAIGFDRYFAEAHMLLGHVLVGQGRLEEAAARFQTAARCAPRLRADRLDSPMQTRALCAAGRALMALGRHAEAYPLFQRAARSFPAYQPSHEMLGRAAFTGGNCEAAADHFLDSYRPAHFVPTVPRLPPLESLPDEIKSASLAAGKSA